MSDDRFDRDLTEILREIAGEEAPMSLRYRLSDITERAPIGRRLWFATPMRLTVVVAMAVAVLALAVLFWPSRDVGPGPSESPRPTPTESVLAPSLSAEPSPSLPPTPTAEPTLLPTPVPTPAPTGEWTGLAWSDPVTPPLPMSLYDVVPWGGGYVAVGWVEQEGGQPRAGAFLTSPDGLNWTVAELNPFGGGPGKVVAFGDELLAFNRPQIDAWPLGEFEHGIWRSSDGSSWSYIDSLSWSGAWAGRSIGPMPDGWDQTQYPIDSGLVDVASGPGGLVAIGNAFSEDGVVPLVLHSRDGRSWTGASLPVGSERAMLNTVVERNGRFVVVGAVEVGPDTSTALAAAWYSDDGLTWLRAPVEAGDFVRAGVGTEFGPLYAAADGLLTCLGNREMGAGGWRFMVAWRSTDGTSWRPVPEPDQMRGCAWTAGDGTRIVSLGPVPAPPPWPGVTGGSTSTDGEHWRDLVLSPVLPDMLERFWVVPDGVVYAGAQSFWFGAAVVD